MVRTASSFFALVVWTSVGCAIDWTVPKPPGDGGAGGGAGQGGDGDGLAAVASSSAAAGGSACDGTGECSKCAECAAQESCAREYAKCKEAPDCAELANCVAGCAGQGCGSKCFQTVMDAGSPAYPLATCVVCKSCPADCDGKAFGCAP